MENIEIKNIPTNVIISIKPVTPQHYNTLDVLLSVEQEGLVVYELKQEKVYVGSKQFFKDFDDLIVFLANPKILNHENLFVKAHRATLTRLEIIAENYLKIKGKGRNYNYCKFSPDRVWDIQTKDNDNAHAALAK